MQRTWSRWRLLRYDLPLTRPLTTGAHTHTRVGLIVVLSDERGNTGLGEAAPLPGLHAVSLGSVQDALVKALSADEPEGLPAVARFAIEGAALMLAARQAGRRPAAVLCADPAERVWINALLTGPDPLAALREAVDGGYRAVKLKVGRGDPGAELAMIASIRAQSASIEIRLDANRAWSMAEAAAFCAEAARHRVAYIEEPLADPAGLTALHEQTGIPLGLDESLVAASPEGAVFPAGVAALVLKPSVLSLTGAMQWAAAARRIGAAAVISGAFESGVGRAVNLALAASVGAPIAGLSTAGWLAQDLLDPPLRPVGGGFDLPVVGALREDRLTGVAAG